MTMKEDKEREKEKEERTKGKVKDKVSKVKNVRGKEEGITMERK